MVKYLQEKKCRVLSFGECVPIMTIEQNNAFICVTTEGGSYTSLSKYVAAGCGGMEELYEYRNSSVRIVIFII